ncbi:MAG: transglycosylase domain-containing protein, partial [Caldilineaceae bacterium]|nr:transglycosylase domain-containing protein [Caldilineaceae bacterium]
MFDRNGQLLWEFFGEGKRTEIPLSQIPPSLIAATISVEDDTFYQNTGLD